MFYGFSCNEGDDAVAPYSVFTAVSRFLVGEYSLLT